MITCSRYHDFSAGHRVYGHEGKCNYLHGHNYRVHFTCIANQLDELGRVIDFSCIKNTICSWLEKNWDHRFLIWENDPLKTELKKLDPTIVITNFNPTAENMGNYLLYAICPKLLKDTNVEVIEVIVEETRKCYATVKRELSCT